MLIIILTVSGALGHYLLRNTTTLVDEASHYNQVLVYLQGGTALPQITLIPGYHYWLTLLARITGLESLAAIRLLSFLSSIGAVALFYRMATRQDRSSRLPRALQFYLMPLFFVYLFLVYTDTLSLFLVLAMFFFTEKRKYAWAGVFGILSMAVRQTNVIWLGMTVLMAVARHWREANLKEILKTAAALWLPVLGLLLFVAFFFINGGVAIGDASHHPPFSFSTGNIYTSLLYFFALFLPLHVYNFRRVSALCKKPWIWAALGAAFLVYMCTFRVDHPYNHLAPHYFIRNALLEYITSSMALQALFFIPMGYAALSAAVTPLQRREHYLLFFCWLLFMLPTWLIECRYYMIPFSLFLLYRKPVSKQTEWAAVVYYMLILAIVFPMTGRHMIFL